MTEDELTLEDLSERSGIEPRTLRSWVSEGLLFPPFKAGRGATYPASNADRALAVRALKDVHGLSLAEIRRRFMMATEEEICGWALEAGTTAAAPGSARDYLRRIQARRMSAVSSEQPGFLPRHNTPSEERTMPSAEVPLAEPMLSAHPVHSGRRTADLTGIERLILKLEEVLGAPAPRRSRGNIWTRIPVTRDLELSVRGELQPRDRVLFEQLADQIRAILTGREKQ